MERVKPVAESGEPAPAPTKANAGSPEPSLGLGRFASPPSSMSSITEIKPKEIKTKGFATCQYTVHFSRASYSSEFSDY